MTVAKEAAAIYFQGKEQKALVVSKLFFLKPAFGFMGHPACRICAIKEPRDTYARRIEDLLRCCRFGWPWLQVCTRDRGPTTCS